MERRRLTALRSSEDDVQTAAAAMTPVGASNRCNPVGMARRRQPVVNRRSDLPALDRRVAGPMVSRDQQDDAISCADRLFERPIDGAPGGIEVHSVEVDDAIRLDRAGAKPFIPASVEGSASRRWWRRRCTSRRPRRGDPLRRHRFWLIYRRLSFDLLTRERPDRGRHPAPQLGLLRAERSHGRQRLWAAGSAPGPKRTCLRRSSSRQGRLPRRCRSGSGP